MGFFLHSKNQHTQKSMNVSQFPVYEKGTMTPAPLSFSSIAVQQEKNNYSIQIISHCGDFADCLFNYCMIARLEDQFPESRNSAGWKVIWNNLLPEAGSALKQLD